MVENTIPIDEFLGVNVTSSGIKGYDRAPDLKHTQKKVKYGKLSNAKIDTYINNLMKKKALIPGSPQYAKVDDWKGAKNQFKIPQEKKVTFLGQIFERGKKKENTSPGPSAYNPESWRRKSSVGRTLGTYTKKEKKISFAEDVQNAYGHHPLLKYDTLDINKLKTRAPDYKIEPKVARFQSVKREHITPSPVAYDTGKARDKSMKRIPSGFISKSPKRTYLQEAVKKSITPGVG